MRHFIFTVRFYSNKIYWLCINPFRKLYWYITRPHTTHGAKCVVENNGNILFVRPTYGDKKWDIPGGLSNQGETLEYAAIREVKEESGVAISGLVPIGTYREHRDFRLDEPTIFYARTDATDCVADGIEIAEAAFFPLTALPENRTPRADLTLDRYRRAKEEKRI